MRQKNHLDWVSITRCHCHFTHQHHSVHGEHIESWKKNYSQMEHNMIQQKQNWSCRPPSISKGHYPGTISSMLSHHNSCEDLVLMKSTGTRALSQCKDCLSRYGDFHHKDKMVSFSIVGIPRLVRQYLYIEMPPWSSNDLQLLDMR